ncbi:hypothetical protein [Yoonia sp. SS1-5]|uniref:Uncharacterized protein n=1 Tax=Yoonia rhodophyticola TaxID=3137370 RepID=A0AAN0MCS3_9RHOB
MAEQDSAPVALDWEKDAVWVQLTAFLLLEDTVDAAADHADPRDTLRLRRQNGEVFEIPRARAAQDYEIIENVTILRPKYEPLQMLRLDHSADVVLKPGDAAVRIAENAVVLRRLDGQISTIDDHTLRCNYAVIAPAGPPPP